MISKLYKLKKLQTDQKILEKAQITNKINDLENELFLTRNKLNSAGVTKFGAISDFTILAIHKNSLKVEIIKLENQISRFKEAENIIIEQVIGLQKESEQFSYILEEEKKESIKKFLLEEEEASTEYVQSKYI